MVANIKATINFYSRNGEISNSYMEGVNALKGVKGDAATASSKSQ